ncbi:MAG: hypothetical protein AB7K86_07180 [Rhodospirillales bacterium]
MLVRILESRAAPWAAVLLVCVVLAPIMAFGQPKGHSAEINLAWHVGFSAELAAGTPYPRWIANGWESLGSPAFYFYGPLPFYVSAAASPLAPVAGPGWHALGLSFAVAAALSGVAAWLWLRAHAPARVAAVAAAVYVVLPYHFEIDMLRRSALGECWAYVWMPLALAGVDRILAARRGGVALVAAAYAGIAFSHVPSVIVFGWVPLLYGVVAADAARWRRTAVVAAAAALGLGLAAPYLAPAALMQGDVSFDAAMWSGHFHYGNNFLFRDWSAPLRTSYTARLHLAFALTALVVATCAVVLRRAGGRWTAAVMTVAAVAAFLCLPLSRPLWDAVGVLQKIQFPFRHMIVLDLCAAALVAAALARALRQRDGRMLAALGGFAVLGAACAAAGLYDARWNIAGDTREAHRLALRGLEAAEYRPRWARTPLGVIDDAAPPDAPVPPVEPAVAAPAGRLIAYARRGAFISADVEAAGPGALVADQFYFPGWVATDRAGRFLEVAPDATDGRLRVAVGAGRTRVTVRRGLTEPELLGLALCAAAAAGLAILIIAERRLTGSAA